jgi:hypothetical protein
LDLIVGGWKDKQRICKKLLNSNIDNENQSYIEKWMARFDPAARDQA